VKTKKKSTTAALAVRGAPGVLLDATAVANDNDAAAVWLEVAYEGSFKGHWMGEFEFTRATFEQIVANFHAHPQYKPVPESITADQIAAGNYGVVQWDMHHASEAPATSGDIPVVGAPAQGWVLDARVGQRADGTATLEALTHWLEPARTYIREKRYKWASVSVVFNAVHPVTKAPIGAVLTSIAVTNQPFLQDLPALAASSRALLDWYPDARTPDDAFGQIRGRLGLPATATVVDAAAEVAKLRSYAAPGATVPAGVDVDAIVSCFRSVLELPLLTTNDEVFAEVDKLFQRLSAPAGATTEEPIMSTNATNTPAAKSPADDLRDSLAMTLAKSRKCDASTVTNTQILMAVESGENAAGDLAALLAALDVPNLPKALSQIDALKQLKVKLDELLPKYEQQQAEIARIDEESALEDVGMALASLNIDPKDESKAPVRASLMRDRKANREKFRTDYKIEEMRKLASAQSATTITTTGGVDPTVALATQRQHGQQTTAAADPFAGVRLGAGGLRIVSPVQDKPGTSAAPKVDLSSFQGRNDVERAIRYLQSQEGTKNLSIDDLNAQASQLVADLRRRGRAA
jgi:hypothetical protein